MVAHVHLWWHDSVPVGTGAEEMVDRVVSVDRDCRFYHMDKRIFRGYTTDECDIIHISGVEPQMALVENPTIMLQIW